MYLSFTSTATVKCVITSILFIPERKSILCSILDLSFFPVNDLSGSFSSSRKGVLYVYPLKTAEENLWFGVKEVQMVSHHIEETYVNCVM